jgi:hypothetical protein
MARLLMWSALSAAAGYGFLNRLRRGAGITEYYPAFYLAVLCVYWTANGRYLFPLFPLYLIYVFEGLRQAAGKLGSRGGIMATRVALAAMLLVDAGNLAASERRAVEDGVLNPSFVELCQYVRSSTAPDAVFLFWNPRVLALYTERKTARYPDWEPERLWSFVARLKTNYVIVFKSYEPDLLFPRRMLNRFPERFQRVYENREFQVFAVRSLSP